MGRIIAMPGVECDDVDLLLPWHIAGTLDGTDQARVENHLARCVRCSADLEFDRQLSAALATDAAETSIGWAGLVVQLDRAEIGSNAWVATSSLDHPLRERRRWRAPLRRLSKLSSLRWVIAAQFAAILALGTIAFVQQPRDGAYRALGEAPAAGSRSGNTLAMFRPELSEALLRRALTRSGARLVDGPTVAGAYVLALPRDANGSHLATLRSQPGVTMAEPIGEGTEE